MHVKSMQRLSKRLFLLSLHPGLLESSIHFPLALLSTLLKGSDKTPIVLIVVPLHVADMRSQVSEINFSALDQRTA